MKKTLLRWGIWCAMKLRIYFLWSLIHQFIFQRKRTKIPTMYTIEDLMLIIRDAMWTADKWWMAGDVIAHPEWAYRNYNETGFIGDCDDYAAFSCHCLNQLGYHNVQMMSVQWLDLGDNFHGHIVALYRDSTNQMYMISNGFLNPMAVLNEEDAAFYWPGLQLGELIAWCTFSPNLWHLHKFQLS